MDINYSSQTAIATAAFGMSACGHATGLLIGSGTTLVVRGRVTKTQAEMGFAVPAYIPVTSAWSPPIS